MSGKKKKITSKIKKKKIIENTKPEFCFKLIDGSEIKNLLELADNLHNMSDDVFYYHVNQEKNDFEYLCIVGIKNTIFNQKFVE